MRDWEYVKLCLAFSLLFVGLYIGREDGDAWFFVICIAFR